MLTVHISLSELPTHVPVQLKVPDTGAAMRLIDALRRSPTVLKAWVTNEAGGVLVGMDLTRPRKS